MDVLVIERSSPWYPCQPSAATEDLRTCLDESWSSSMLNLHVGLVRLVDDVLTLFVHHLRLTVLSVHHGHLAAVADLRRVALLRTNWVGAIRRRRVMLLVLRWTLALDGLVMHRNAHVSLIL